MSFYKNYPNRKDHRHPGWKTKAFDPSCRNHRSCPWCRSNRTIADRKNDDRARSQNYEINCDCASCQREPSRPFRGA